MYNEGLTNLLLLFMHEVQWRVSRCDITAYAQVQICVCYTSILYAMLELIVGTIYLNLTWGINIFTSLHCCLFVWHGQFVFHVCWILPNVSMKPLMDPEIYWGTTMLDFGNVEICGENVTASLSLENFLIAPFWSASAWGIALIFKFKQISL